MASPGAGSFMWFLVIVAIIPLALWLLKRTPWGGAASSTLMRSVAVLPISPNQRIVMIEVGGGEERRWLVLGVTPQQITTLHSMSPQDEPPLATDPAVVAPFSQLMANLKAGRSGDRT